MAACGNKNDTTDGDSTRERIVNISLLSEEQSSKYVAAITSGTLNSPVRICLIGSLLVLISSSGCYKFLSFNDRRQSFAGVLDPPRAELWAQSGFYWDGGGASCFYCGVHTDQLGLQDPLQQHASLCPDCHLLRLLRSLAAEDLHAAAKAGLAKDAVWYERLLKALWAGLGQPIVKFVGSFGFSMDEVALAVLQHIVVNNSGSDLDPNRKGIAGLLVKLVQCLPAEIHPLGQLVLRLIDTWAKHFQYGGLSDGMTNTIAPPQLSATTNHIAPVRNEIGPAASVAAESAQPQTTTATATTPVQRREEDADNPSCVRCRATQRNVVLLPCAHLALCKMCAQQHGNCPVCGRLILAIIPAFLC